MLTRKDVRLALGGFTGLVSLLAMIRLVSDGFSTPMSPLAWGFVLLAMVPWIGYASWRARHGHLTARAGLAVLTLCVAGLLSVWLFTVGAVLALAFSLAAFVIIWVHDWPPRRARGEDQFVRIEDLVADEPE